MRWVPVSTLLIMVLAAVQGFVFMVTVPPWSAPDEPQHFAYVRYLWYGETGSDTSVVEAEILASMEVHDWYRKNHMNRPVQKPVLFFHVPFFTENGIPIGYHPPSYYELGRLTVGLAGQENLDAQLYFVRAMSVLLSAAAVGLAYLTALVLFPGDRVLCLTIGAVAALFPQRAFVAGTVNNDNLAVLAGSVVFFLATYLIVRGANLLGILALAAACVLAPASKRTALPVLIAPAATLFGLLLGEVAVRWPRRRVMVLSTGGVMVALSAALLVGEAAVNEPTSASLSRSPVWEIPLRLIGFMLSAEHLQPERLETYGMYASSVVESFWARFGWMNVLLPDGWYLAVRLLTALAFVGAGRYVWDTWNSKSSPHRLDAVSKALIVSALTVIGGLGMAVMVQIWPEPHGLPQGRYALPVLVPFVLVFCVGLRSLLPTRAHAWFGPMVVVCMLTLNFVCLVQTIFPFHYSYLSSPLS